uniref:F-box only protein 40 n=2 Tax=Schistocephalus solidus TaxID=70667 RepID=A0A0X3P6J5_SCHSO
MESFCMKHCLDCIRSDCNVLECPVVFCPLRCGHRLHSCKIDDHLENICKLSIVSCTNRNLGCPRSFQRCELGRHLVYCPASIVHCTVEWNRWPRFMGEKYPFLLPPNKCRAANNKPLPQEVVPEESVAFQTRNFDLALTARDQAVLEKSTRVSARTKGALRSCLTQLYPALPMTSPLYHGAFQVGRDGSRFSLIPSPLAVASVTPSGIPVPNSFRRPQELWVDSAGEDASSPSPNETDISSGNHSDQSPENDGTVLSRSLPCHLVGYSSVRPGLSAASGDDSAVAHIPSKQCFRPSSLSEKMSWAINDRSLQVDCQVQFVPRYVQKPLAMYTFLCDLDVPRRSFGYHCRLHCDALAQADYWLEQRCPLAYLGCPFSIVRLRPNLPDAVLVYMPAFASFSIRYPEQSVPEVSPTASNAGSSKVNFNDLPTEILLQISHYLDEISLIILSKVSERLASFCLSLLPSRGIVAPVWRRRDAASDGGCSWRIANFVWTLPFKGEKVRRWHISQEDVAARISAHLATCPFYEVVRMEAPFRLLNCPEKLPFA